MKPSSRPAACSAALKLAMSALIAAWPVYVSLSTHTGQRAARGPVVMPESGSPVGGRELHPVAPIGEAREHDLTGPRPMRWQIVEPRGAKLEPAQTLERVAPPRPVVHTVPHRLAELAVPGNGDAQVLLAAHDVPDARTELRLESTLVARLA